MNSRVKYFLAAIILHITFNTAFGQSNEKIPLYNLKIKAEPASGTIECKAEIKNPPDSCFILNKDMEIYSIIADGKKVSFNQKPSDFLPNSSEIVIESGVHNYLAIEYSGKIKAESYPPMISYVNMVKPELVELAIYTAWYPRFKQGSVSFNLEADLPANYLTVTNGNLKGQKTENNRNITKWESYSPGFDIALLAAPNLQKSEINQDGVTVEIYYDKVPKSYVDSMKSYLIKSMNILTSSLGATDNKIIRVAYSPRSAWGYVRTPFIIVSEGNTLDWRSQKFGFARDFRYLTHEISHYWWSLANINTPDDWINEGLAEYSAFLISNRVFGKDFPSLLLKEYNERAGNSKTETAIAETENSSPDREVNRYDKPVIIFNELLQKYGQEKMVKFLKSLYIHFKETKAASTASFLDVVEKQFGKDERDHFSNALFTKKWNTADIIQSKAN